MNHADTLRGMAADQLRTGRTLLSAPHKTRGDALLAGAAPDAVAEVIRLRRELEELREVFVRAAEMMGKFEIPADRQQAQGFAGRLTRILEGTHE